MSLVADCEQLQSSEGRRQGGAVGGACGRSQCAGRELLAQFAQVIRLFRLRSDLIADACSQRTAYGSRGLTLGRHRLAAECAPLGQPDERPEPAHGTSAFPAAISVGAAADAGLLCEC